MKAHNLSLQQAFDFVGLKFRDLMEKFLVDKERLRSFGPQNDPQVHQFVAALEHWIIGNLVWSFETQRYFGPQHEEIRRTLVIQLIDDAACGDEGEGEASGGFAFVTEREPAHVSDFRHPSNICLRSSLRLQPRLCPST